MLTLTSKILVKYQKLLVNANPVWTNNYMKRPNIYTGASTNRRSHTGASSVWSYSDMYQHSAYLRPHKPSYVKTLTILLLVSFLPHAHKTQDTSSLLTVLYHWRELPQVIFVVTKVLSWQRQKTCFVATKLFVVTKIILVAAPTKNCFVVSNGVCMRVCGERLLREKNGGWGVGGGRSTLTHIFTHNNLFLDEQFGSKLL